jgi:guanyl-specific ribonuclease Sa
VRKLNLLAFALLLGAASTCTAAIVAQAKSNATPVLSLLGGIDAVQIAEPPAPLLASVHGAQKQPAANVDAGACVPNADIVPGVDFYPKIEDDVRIGAINGLLEKISSCKPLPYDHDGITFTNREGVLPQAAKDFYKEYTLIVSGRETGDGPVPVVIGGKTYMTGEMLSKRGPERIMIGGGKLVYYTPDHYTTFIELKIVK